MKIFFIVIIIFFFSKLNATTIFDYEIEVFLEDIILIALPSKNHTDDLEFSILLNENPNAFIDEKNQIYITTGLLKYIENVEALIGVMAHEIGHIKNYHISKRKKSIEDLKLINQLGNLTAIASSIIANKPELLIQTALTNNININNYYSSFSKDQEREADVFALSRLKELQISPLYLKKFLLFLDKESYKKGISKDNFIFSTHPNYNERLDLISNFEINNEFKEYKALNKRFQFIRAKLFGYTENKTSILSNNLSNDYSDYAKAIIISKKGKLLESLKIINNLISKNPDNIHLLETKADILYRFGYTKESKKFYELALLSNQKNRYVFRRIFQINYDNINNSDKNFTKSIFLEYKELIYLFPSDLILLKKFKKILNILEYKDWKMYIDAEIDIVNNRLDIAMDKLKKASKITKEQKLLKKINERIKDIENK